jgi:hypothetical protein
MAHNPECGLDCVSAGAVRLDNPASPNQQTGRQHLSGDQSAEQAKHTPGPWHVDPRAAARVCAGLDTVASCGNDSGLRDAWEANARLIAAAPDLLRVAHLLVSWLDEEEGAHKLCDAARAAIAKAEGRGR